MKKSLLICGGYPIPENIGGNMRTMNFVRFLRTYGTVDICYAFKTVQGVSGNSIFSHEFHLNQNNPPAGYGQHFENFLKGIPYPIRRYSDDSQRLLESLMLTEDYDYVLVRYVYNAAGLFPQKDRFGSRVMMDFDDVLSGSLYETRFYPTCNPFKRLLRNLNKSFLKKYEKKCLTFGTALFCSEKDREEVVHEKYRNNSFVVPNIYDNDSFEKHAFGDGCRQKDTLLFVGTLNYAPNVEGLKWFIESIWGRFREAHPGAELLAVGRLPTEEVVKLCNATEGVELQADAPDIKQYYERCRAVVVPLLAGGGTRIKILEAALAGRPVLSTPVGAEGLELADETDLLLFEDYDGFEERFNKLRDENYYKSLVENARRLVLEQYSKRTFEAAMEQVLNHIEEKRKKA